MNKAEQINCQIDALEAIRREKEHIRSQLRQSNKKINAVSQRIFEPLPATSNRIVGVSRLVSNGLAVYEGLRMGSGFIRAVRTFFHRQQRVATPKRKRY